MVIVTESFPYCGRPMASCMLFSLFFSNHKCWFLKFISSIQLKILGSLNQRFSLDAIWAKNREGIAKGKKKYSKWIEKGYKKDFHPFSIIFLSVSICLLSFCDPIRYKHAYINIFKCTFIQLVHLFHFNTCIKFLLFSLSSPKFSLSPCLISRRWVCGGLCSNFKIPLLYFNTTGIKRFLTELCIYIILFLSLFLSLI